MLTLSLQLPRAKGEAGKAQGVQYTNVIVTPGVLVHYGSGLVDIRKMRILVLTTDQVPDLRLCNISGLVGVRSSAVTE